MEVIDLSLSGLKLIKPRLFKDARGYFTESYRENIYKEKGIDVQFVQDNHSFSYKNVIRGLHFQKTQGQDKLVFAGYGKIFDVAVDLREESPTFGKWEGVILDDIDCHQLFIPKGFAHGFCVLSDSAHLIYKVSAYFDPKTEVSLKYNDTKVGIKWPIDNPILSEKDENALSFGEIFS